MHFRELAQAGIQLTPDLRLKVSTGGVKMTPDLAFGLATALLRRGARTVIAEEIAKPAPKKRRGA